MNSVVSGKRKFVTTLLVLLSSVVALFTGHLDQTAWVTVATLSLSIYSGANIVDKKLGGLG